MFRLGNGIYGQRQGGQQPDGAGEGAVRVDRARAARDDRPGRRRRTRAGGVTSPRGRTSSSTSCSSTNVPEVHASPRFGRADHPRGVRRHGAQHAGLSSRRRVPARGARHQPVGRGGVPSLRAQPARPAAAPQVQDQLLRLRDRLRSGDVQRRRCDRDDAHATTTATVEAGFRVFIAGGLGANPHPALALEEFTPREELLPTIEAMLRVFDQAGNRDNKLRARMKWLVDTLGFDEVQRRVLEDPQAAARLVDVAGRHPRHRRAARRRSGGSRRRDHADGDGAGHAGHVASAATRSRGWDQANVVRGIASGACLGLRVRGARRHHRSTSSVRSPRSSASSVPTCG